MNELPTLYTDWLYIEPVVDVGVIGTTLNYYAKVLGVGPEVKHTEVGEVVAYEKWDKPEFPLKGKTYHFLREKDALCKIPPSWL